MDLGLVKKGAPLSCMNTFPCAGFSALPKPSNWKQIAYDGNVGHVSKSLQIQYTQERRGLLSISSRTFSLFLVLSMVINIVNIR